MADKDRKPGTDHDDLMEELHETETTMTETENSESDSQEEEDEYQFSDTDSDSETEDDDRNDEFQGSSGLAITRADFNHKISDMRGALKNSLLDLAKANRDATTIRQYMDVLECRQSVVEKMADQWGDQVYSKFEWRWWFHLFHYFNSEKNQADKDTLAQSIIGTLELSENHNHTDPSSSPTSS